MAWDDEQFANARLIIAIGREMGMKGNEILSGLMAAMQESSLRNITYGDRDSIGLFQQRPSQGWGSYSQIMDPLYATRKYFSTLKGVKNREAMSPTVMAQSVQRSAYPNAYAKWQAQAQELMMSRKKFNELPFPLKGPKVSIEDMVQPTGGTVSLDSAGSEGLGEASGIDLGTGAGVSLDAAVGAGTEAPTEAQTEQADPNFENLQKLLGMMNQNPEDFDMPVAKNATRLRQSIIDAASSAIGTPYVWGGESYAEGGFDCSGLITWAMKRAGIKFNGRFTTYNMRQMMGGKSTQNLNQLRPGDWVFAHPDQMSNGQATFGHVMIWLGDGWVLEAPNRSAPVRKRKLSKAELNGTLLGYALNLAGD